jgi:hypothetical protein
MIINTLHAADNKQGGELFETIIDTVYCYDNDFSGVFCRMHTGQPGSGTASPTSVPYPDAEDNINNYNNGLALKRAVKAAF